MRALVILAALAACRPPGSSTLQVNGVTRHFEEFVPTDTPGMPLVIALHGRGSTGKQMERFTHLDDIAAREQFAVVYPDGIDHRWNDGRQPTGIDDVAFIAHLIDDMAARHAIDRSRVFVTGMSNGAMMSYRLACDLSDRIVAIAPVAGDLPTGPCKPVRPVSVLAINGTDDPLVPYAGGVAGRGGTVLSSPDSTEFFARADGCTDTITRDEPDPAPDDGVRSHDRRYRCPARLDVELVTLEGGGHTWPGGPQYLPKVLIGPTSRDFDASERIWEFFSDRE
jgi:polyhydroxybutyrate depolymerase